MVDRSTKPPPQVNRAMKPKALTQTDHSYYNMAPPVDRGSKHNRGNMSQPEHSYINCGSLSQQRPQHLPLLNNLNGNPYVGSLPNQQNRWPAVHEDAEYCLMDSVPTRSSSSRCYSFGKDGSQKPLSDQSYEDMSAIQTKRLSGTKSSSSSSSSLGDNDEYTHMTPRHVGPSPIQVCAHDVMISFSTVLPMSRSLY